MTTTEAYAFCRQMARREAKNFYWAFRVLPRAKSDAMCAVYAFMRRADDLADDETLSITERRTRIADWGARWRNSSTESIEHAEDAAIFIALREAQRRFSIPQELLEELVEGVTMDLEPQNAGVDGLQTFVTFDELYRYCYLVASVVGLVCIRIFGYEDARAEGFAEETGVAFQLTNILRDVREDAERGRLYIPEETMVEFEVPVTRILTLAEGTPMTPKERAMLATLGVQAERYYGSARKLIPLLHRDSRAAMWVLTMIYHRLLNRIAAAKMEVFGERVSVPGWEKAAILVWGAAMAVVNRVAG